MMTPHVSLLSLSISLAQPGQLSQCHFLFVVALVTESGVSDTERSEQAPCPGGQEVGEELSQHTEASLSLALTHNTL